VGTENNGADGATGNVSRRRVVAGAAWAVPAVVVGSAAPAMAASPVVVVDLACACKTSNNMQYRLLACFTNNGSTTATVTIDETTIQPQGGGDVEFGTHAAFDVAVGACVCVVLTTTTANDNASAGDVTIRYTFVNASGSETATAGASFNNISDCNSAPNDCLTSTDDDCTTIP
jgi:hypothetical protein